MSDNVKLSVIITALNEESNILDAFDNVSKAIKDYRIDGEIIIVDDGSTDRTQELIRRIIIKDKRAKTLRHNTPQGTGASFRDGVDIASGDIVVWFPGDNENDFYEILRYAGLLEHVDMVVPFVFNKDVRPLFRNVLSDFYRFIINVTFRVNFNYTNGTTLYRKSMLLDIKHKSNGFFFQTEILVKSAKRGYLFAQVPCRLGVRTSGTSKSISFPSFIRVLAGYFRLIKDVYFMGAAKIARFKFSNGSKSQERCI
jgi:dolichol-phosphate mannosyltransferase